MYKDYLYFLLLSVYLMSFSCKPQDNNGQQVNPNDYKEDLMRVNKLMNENEDEQIDLYVKRHNWEMEKTGTGLRYMVYNEGDGDKAEKGKVAVLNYSVDLLNGTKIYSSENDGQKGFLIGKGGVESGLEEGILLLREGDRAKFILPSHMAFGLAGDDNKIPARAALVYDIELVELRN